MSPACQLRECRDRIHNRRCPDDENQIRFLERVHAPLTVVSSTTALPEIARLLAALAAQTA